MVAVHDEPTLCLELLEARRAHEFLVRRIHEHTSRGDPAFMKPDTTLKIGTLLPGRNSRFPAARRHFDRVPDGRQSIAVLIFVGRTLGLLMQVTLDGG
jgi:hypothetical protein